ncbi:MAG: bacteriohemerythrin [Rhodocyclaceae bacterium]|nr:bacteriohemerythrin [Rhodocyclaceae bacterium]
MNQNTQEIGKLLFDLTLSSGTGPNLERVLERLFHIIAEFPSLRLQQKGAILLINPVGDAVQVAQFGMPPIWSSGCSWHTLRDLDPPDGESVLPLSCHCPGGPGGGACRCEVCALVLRDETRLLGYTVLFPEGEDWPQPETGSVMNDLARALSGLVGRCLVGEVVKVREWELEEARTEAIHRLGSAAEYRDNETGWHVMRMTNYALAIAKHLGLPEAMRELLYVTAPMHDVGKIGIPDAILLKPGRLTEEELDVMRRHTEIGETILEGGDCLITAAREIAGAHHERWDGQGYPRGQRGEDIPILARVCAVADVFDALTSPRPYKHAWPLEEALTWVHDHSGTQFDPAVVRAFDTALPDILRIRELYRDDIIDPKQVLSLPPPTERPDGWVSWDESLAVGIAVIDEHHRHLFDLVNDLYEVVSEKRGAREVAQLLKALDLYARVHFSAEEKMMAHYAYAGLDRQKHQHHRFQEKLQAFYEELHVNPLTAQYDVLEFTRHWLVVHILEEDSQLKVLTEMPGDSAAS